MGLRTNLLAHFSPMFDFYTPWKRQKTQGFLTFSDGIEMENWGKTDERKISGNFGWESPILELRFIYDEWKNQYRSWTWHRHTKCFTKAWRRNVASVLLSQKWYILIIIMILVFVLDSLWRWQNSWWFCRWLETVTK